MLAERRRNLHERAAQAIEALFAGRLEDHLSELAHHYDRSGNPRKAVEYLGRAGVRAAQQVAHPEAIGYFTRALELLKHLPDGMDRNRTELDLQMALAWSLFVAKGAGAAEREPILNRARELCERLGDSTKLMEILLAHAFFCLWRGEDDMGRELGQRVVALAEQSQAPAMLARAHSQLGTMLVTTGQLEEAREHLERALKLFGPGPFSRFPSVQSYEIAGAASFLNVALAELGYPATAIRKSRELKDAARQVSDPVLIARLLFSDALLYVYLRDDQAAVEQAEELLSIATEHGLAFRLAQANFFQGWAMAIAGQAPEGMAEMRRALSDMKAFGWTSNRPLFFAMAEACLKNKLPEEGIAAAAEGLEVSSGHFDAGLQRLKGELLLIQCPPAEADAERCFRDAIEIARLQKAKFWELRATTSLARLLRKQGKSDDARHMLSGIYGWFTEGFDTADLKDAKALLEELGG